MPLAIPKILVVADPGEQRELVALLRGAGAPFTEAVIAVDDGDDGTLAQFVELRPAVVVVAASLTAGDTRSLVAAMRDAAPGGVFIVLLGDERGPVRNALDAIDFGCDRFVARPLAVKALRFAVMSGLGAAAGAPGRTEPGNGRAAMIGPRGTEPMAAVRVAEPMAAVGRSEPVPVAARITEPMAAVWGAEPPAARTTRPMTAVEAAVEIAAPVEVDAAVTAPVRARTTTISAQRARWEALADAIGTGDGLGEGGDDVDAADAADAADAPLITSRVPTGEIEVGIEHTIHAEPPPRHHAAAGPDLAEDIVLREALFDDLSGDGPARPLDRAAAPPLARHEDEVEPLAAESPTPIPPAGPWRPGSTEVPDVPVREPTLVLGEVSPPPPLAPPAPVELIERHAEGPEGGGWSSASQVSPAPDDDDDVLADVAAGVDDDLSIDLAPEERGPGAPLPVVAEPPPSGGDFARELRRKMSAMAERLFRGGDLPASPVAIGPGHDHHTEIDLGGLVDDPSLLGGGEAFDLAGGATFVGSEDHVTSTQGTEARGTAEAGEIQRGVSDAAALIARMFAADFTGRIVFRRGPVEKVIHVESGRPVFASSSLAHDRMGELLLREGKITAEQYARCRDLVRDTGRRMGEILVERGFLKRRELLPAVRRHVEDIIYSLFAWDHGEYRIVAGDGAASERIRLSRHPAAMVLEGVRRKLDRPSLERLLGPTSTIVETTDRDKVAAITGVADLSAEERAALAAFDGAADLAQVARQSGAGLANVYQLAWSLHLLGLATTRRRAGEDEGDAPALVGESDLAIDRDRVRARHALVLDADYFALLGVRRDATGFEIKRAYEAARRDFAADTFPSELRRELSAELDDIAEVLDEAYRVLHDDALRAAYVRHLRDFGSSTS